MFSLADAVGCDPKNFLLVYSARCATSAWWTKFLDPRMAHVEIWYDLGQGFFLALQPYHDRLEFSLVEGRPSGLVQQVTARRRNGKLLFPFGTKTCVSVVKATLGINAPAVITPRQLFNYVQNNRGIV